MNKNYHKTIFTIKDHKYRCFKNRKNYFFQFVLLIVLCIFPVFQGKSQEYPFKNLPDTIVATLNVETTKTEPFNNKLLGYNISRFTSGDEKDIIKKFDPITIRFPQGIFSNWYDWRIDDFTFYSPLIDEAHKAVVDGQPKAGVAGLESLNNDKKQTNNVGYDFLITWNMSDDAANGNNSTTNTESIERLKHYKAIGFDVNAIEFGNELFYRNQRSPFVPDEAAFLERAKSLSKDLKEIDNDLKLSIPLIPRGSFTNPNWNEIIAADKSYFDAITVHKYIGVDVDNRLDLSNIGYEFGLAARLTLSSAINFARTYAQDKPVWLTEWGVDVGESPTGNAASCLGMADCYIYMSENQDIYQRANWFCANGSANQMIKLVDGTFSTIEYPLKKTGYGFTYDIIRSVFENSTLLSSKVSTPTRLELIGSSVDAVSARVVKKEGKTLILALNLTDKPAEFHINLDGSIFSDGYKLESVIFSDAADLPLILFDKSPFNFTENGSGMITLPPLSVNKITLKGPVEYDVNFESPSNGARFDVGTKLVVEANAGSAVSKVSLFINDDLVRSITNAPFIWGENTIADAALNQLESGFYQLKLVAENADTVGTSESITIEIQDTLSQPPFSGVISIPGKFEAENYDSGGEGIAYHDSDGNNQAGEYRTDGVDIGTSGTGYTIAYSSNNEWLEYTIVVSEDGEYDIAIYYSSARSGGGAKIGSSLPDENMLLLESFELPVTAGWGNYEEITIASRVSFKKGKHILRLTVKERGYNLDWVEIRKSKLVGTKEQFANKLMVYPNPNSKGIFNLSKWNKWEVYSIVGQKMSSGEGNKVDISQFQKGFYILKTEESVHKILYE